MTQHRYNNSLPDLTPVNNGRLLIDYRSDTVTTYRSHAASHGIC
jgi:hypothetical protein